MLFCDVSGYTRLSEELAPDALNAMVESYFSAFLDVIQAAGGDINETAGDGFMTIFDARTRYVHAASGRSRNRVLEIAQRLNREHPHHPLEIHMGLNSGCALVGSTRFEGARGSRWTFTASGPVTNLAARLAGVAQAGQIVAGPETVRRLGDRYRVELLTRERLKNMREMTEIYQLLSLHRYCRDTSPGISTTGQLRAMAEYREC